ncbi:hypothetical protein N2152v2_004910 [Parachlorella kessleri]
MADRDKLEKYLKKNPIPVVLGRGRVPYMVDHHHLACALLKNQVEQGYYTIKEDWSSLGEQEFWDRMKAAAYLWLFDEGRPLTLQQLVQRLPKDVTGLRDDPFRSLAAFVRYRGGYEKVWVPFSEFKWADYFRTHLQINGPTEPDNEQLLQQAVAAAAHPVAGNLPGFTGGKQAAGDGLGGPLDSADTKQVAENGLSTPPGFGGGRQAGTADGLGVLPN